MKSDELDEIEIVQPFMGPRHFERLHSALRDEYYRHEAENDFKRMAAAIQTLPEVEPWFIPSDDDYAPLRYYNDSEDRSVYIFGRIRGSDAVLELYIDPQDCQFSASRSIRDVILPEFTEFTDRLDLEYNPSTLGSIRWTHRIPFDAPIPVTPKVATGPTFQILMNDPRFDESRFGKHAVFITRHNPERPEFYPSPPTESEPEP